MMKYFLIVGLVSLISSCGQAQVNVQIIGADELVELKDSGALLIDVRSSAELKKGKIPGAIHVPITNSFAESMNEYDKNEPVILYCHSGVRSTNAARQLSAAGYKKIYNYTGSYLDWTRSGRSVEEN